MLSQENQARCHEDKRLDDFNALAFEEQRHQIFQQTEASVLSESYLDGRWDGGLAQEPTAQQWLDSDFRKGYLEGIANRLNEKYGLV